MNIVLYVSNIMIPLLFFYIIGYGLLSKTDIFDAFIKGAMDGLKVVVKIVPTLIGLMIAIGILRSSGFLEVLSKVITPFANWIHFPASLVPLSIIKMVSSSAATGLLVDIYKKYGPDSTEGYMGSLLMCCSETIFYTISVYFMATKDHDHKPVNKMRWMLSGALISTFAGMAACVVIVQVLGK